MKAHFIECASSWVSQTSGLWASQLAWLAPSDLGDRHRQNLLALICSAGKIKFSLLLSTAKETIVILLFVLRSCKEIFISNPFLMLGAISGWLSNTRTFSCCRCGDIQMPAIPAQLPRVFQRWYTNKLQTLWGIANASFPVIEMTFNGIQQCRCRKREFEMWGPPGGFWTISQFDFACLPGYMQMTASK